MSDQDRAYAVSRHPLVAGASDDVRDLVASAVADAEAQITGALALWVQGDGSGLRAMLDASAAPVIAGIPIVACFCAAREALDAAIGDDPTRGFAAVTVLQERAAEYSALAHELKSRHAEQHPENRPDAK